MPRRTAAFKDALLDCAVLIDPDADDVETRAGEFVDALKLILMGVADPQQAHSIGGTCGEVFEIAHGTIVEPQAGIDSVFSLRALDELQWRVFERQGAVELASIIDEWATGRVKVTKDSRISRLLAEAIGEYDGPIDFITQRPDIPPYGPSNAQGKLLAFTNAIDSLAREIRPLIPAGEKDTFLSRDLDHPCLPEGFKGWLHTCGSMVFEGAPWTRVAPLPEHLSSKLDEAEAILDIPLEHALSHAEIEMHDLTDAPCISPEYTFWKDGRTTLVMTIDHSGPGKEPWPMITGFEGPLESLPEALAKEYQRYTNSRRWLSARLDVERRHREASSTKSHAFGF